VTAEGKAKKEVAAKTGQSLREVQRVTSKKPKHTPEPARPRSAVASNEALFDFTARTLDIVRRTRGQEVRRFAGTAVPAGDLATLGKFYTELAKLKGSGAGRPTKGFVPQGNGLVSADVSGEKRKAENAKLDATDELAGVT
jgi:hypothetical protein